MREWTVYAEAWAPAGNAGSLDVADSRVEDFVDALAGASGIVSVDQHRWAATVTVEAGTAGLAVEQGSALISSMAVQFRLPTWPVERIEAVEADRQDSGLQVSNFPDIVGMSEAASLLGISRQRVHELRKAGRFPEPMVELAAGPIWLRPAIEAFNERWDRRPGRPKATMTASPSGHRNRPE
jgi:predicted DNA-binding transcriptional regulator AlpA